MLQCLEGGFSAGGFTSGLSHVEIQHAFFEATFSVMGHLAKADGRVSEEEIALAREVMSRMGLSEQARHEAIALFSKGKASDFALDEMLEKARVTVDNDARMAIYKDVQRYINENTLDVILWFRNGTIGAQPNVMGLDTVVQPNGSEMNFHRVWLKA